MRNKQIELIISGLGMAVFWVAPIGLFIVAALLRLTGTFYSTPILPWMGWTFLASWAFSVWFIHRREKLEPRCRSEEPPIRKPEPAKPQTAEQFQCQQFLSAMNQVMPKEQARQQPQRKTNYSYDYATRKAESAEFYRSPAWRTLRARALHLWGSAPCACCNEPFNGRVKHVDHIKPRSKYPHLALKLSNLQVMCEDCNVGKGNHFEVDWRTPAQKRAFDAI